MCSATVIYKHTRNRSGKNQNQNKKNQNKNQKQQDWGAGEDICPQVVTKGDTSRARCLLIIINYVLIKRASQTLYHFSECIIDFLYCQGSQESLKTPKLFLSCPKYLLSCCQIFENVKILWNTWTLGNARKCSLGRIYCREPPAKGLRKFDGGRTV